MCIFYVFMAKWIVKCACFSNIIIALCFWPSYFCVWWHNCTFACELQLLHSQSPSHTLLSLHSQFAHSPCSCIPLILILLLPFPTAMCYRHLVLLFAFAICYCYLLLLLAIAICYSICYYYLLFADAACTLPFKALCGI